MPRSAGTLLAGAPLFHIDRIVPCLSEPAGENNIEGNRICPRIIWLRLIENERAVRPARIALVALIVLLEVGESLAIFDRQRAVRRLFEPAHGRLSQGGTIRLDGNKKFEAQFLAADNKPGEFEFWRRSRSRRRSRYLIGV